MNVTLQKPCTAEQFLAWARAQEGRYEFDGVRPIAMTGGDARHDLITGNITIALRSRLRGTSCASFGPNLGVRTNAAKIRYPDALITCTKFPQTDSLAPDAVVIFEVVSPTSGRTDRIEKLHEYALMPSMRRYIIVETRFAGVLRLHRTNAGEAWLAAPLTVDDCVEIPEVAISIPVSEFYEGVEFSDDPPGD